MSEKLLQAILDELKSLNEWNGLHHINLIDIEHKLDLLVENEEEKAKFLVSLKEDVQLLDRGLTKIENSVKEEMPHLGSMEYIVEGAFSKVNETLKKIERNTN